MNSIFSYGVGTHRHGRIGNGLFRWNVVLPLLVALTGCASKQAYMGHGATDLSGLRPGTPRTEIETLIGAPERLEPDSGRTRAWYVFDRGFVGSLEETSAGEKILWAPVMAWGELVSLGLAGLMTRCQTPCQKGLLEVHYDPHEHLIEAREDFLPDFHPEVSNCARTAVRADFAICQGVRERVRPSSLPR